MFWYKLEQKLAIIRIIAINKIFCLHPHERILKKEINFSLKIFKIIIILLIDIGIDNNLIIVIIISFDQNTFLSVIISTPPFGIDKYPHIEIKKDIKQL